VIPGGEGERVCLYDIEHFATFILELEAHKDVNRTSEQTGGW